MIYGTSIDAIHEIRKTYPNAYESIVAAFGVASIIYEDRTETKEVARLEYGYKAKVLFFYGYKIVWAKGYKPKINLVVSN